MRYSPKSRVEAARKYFREVQTPKSEGAGEGRKPQPDAPGEQA